MADDTVTLKLAHPLSADQAKSVGAEPRQYAPGDDVTVPVNSAMTVINAGYAQVDPADGDAVRMALGPAAPDGTATASPPPGVPATSPPAVPRPVTGTPLP